jgi:hypothetical protein
VDLDGVDTGRALVTEVWNCALKGRIVPSSTRTAARPARTGSIGMPPTKPFWPSSLRATVRTGPAGLMDRPNSLAPG